ncbi:MAG: hypothetical protein EOP26_08015, partial [Rhodococcus sp. (in: high G+C Gram-positive bacteria)]
MSSATSRYWTGATARRWRGARFPPTRDWCAKVPGSPGSLLTMTYGDSASPVERPFGTVSTAMV